MEFEIKTQTLHPDGGSWFQFRVEENEGIWWMKISYPEELNIPQDHVILIHGQFSNQWFVSTIDYLDLHTSVFTDYVSFNFVEKYNKPLYTKSGEYYIRVLPPVPGLILTVEYKTVFATSEVRSNWRNVLQNTSQIIRFDQTRNCDDTLVTYDPVVVAGEEFDHTDFTFEGNANINAEDVSLTVSFDQQIGGQTIRVLGIKLKEIPDDPPQSIFFSKI